MTLRKFRLPFTVAVTLACAVPLVSQTPPARRGNHKGLNTWLLKSAVANLDQASELGVATVRIELPWETVEPIRGQFDWTLTDAAIDAARAKQIEVLFTLRAISSWGISQQARRADLMHGASAPTAMADWERFVGTLASRYKGRGVAYEIENEVNANYWAGSLAEYLDLLKTSYRVIRANAPDARVLPSAMACGVVLDLGARLPQARFREKSDDWLKPILATKAFDVVNVHDYYFPSERTVNGWTFLSYLTRVADLMRAAGVSDRPIWITEVGYLGQPGRAGRRVDPGSPEQQALWLVQAYRQAEEAGVERIFWLFLHDGRENETYFSPMGLADAQGKQRPAWKALAGIDAR